MCEQNKTETRKLKIFISHFAKLRIYYLSYSQLQKERCAALTHHQSRKKSIHSAVALFRRRTLAHQPVKQAPFLYVFRASRGKREISVKKALGTRPTQGEEHEKLNPSICKYLASHKFHPLAKELKLILKTGICSMRQCHVQHIQTYHLINKEALTELCSVLKHGRSGQSTREVKGKHCEGGRSPRYRDETSTL